MSPRAADPALRTALVENAARLLAVDGPSGLTLRKLADEVGSSTMAIYTYFGGMPNLLQAVRKEGFDRFRAYLTSVTPTEDPVGDLVLLARAYHDNALANPHLYRAMFMAAEAPEEPMGEDTFELLVQFVARGISAERFAPADPRFLSVQFWSAIHGVVSLNLPTLLPPGAKERTIDALVHGLCVAFGDDPAATARSFDRAARGSRTPLRRS
ncbi:MAG: TetR/AcrR family transcriptional regulator [Sporichthyaceae bacterium]